MPAEIKVIADFYDFMLWMIQHTEKFPRHHRYSLGTDIERQLRMILALLLRQVHRREGAPPASGQHRTGSTAFSDATGKRLEGASDQEPRVRGGEGAVDRIAGRRMAAIQGGRIMKRYGNLWDSIVSWENLVLAARKAQQGKRDRLAVQNFNFFQEARLLRLQRELVDGTYQPGGFRSHWITHPKPRMISAAPYRDRVVHHALMNVLEPILERHFHPHSYACRQGKGTHAAADRLQELMRRHKYALQCDIQRFFPSIDHEILKATFRRLIKDRRALWLMDLIVDNSNEQPGGPTWFAGDDLFTPSERRRGLPIGNLTSQWFANWALTGLDHYVTSHLGLGAYVRYCDDFILLDNERQRLRDARAEIIAYLEQQRLQLHEDKAAVRPTGAGLTFVGYRTWATHRLIRKSNIHAFRRRVRWMKQAYASEEIAWPDVKCRLASWIGHARQADSHRLMRRLSREWTFSRGEAEWQPCSSRGQLEQQCEQLSLCEPQQQHARQPEQQQRVPLGPALSADEAHPPRNHAVHGPRERGLESPGFVPVPSGSGCRTDGRIHAVRPDGAGRQYADGPVRLVLHNEDALPAGRVLGRNRECA